MKLKKQTLLVTYDIICVLLNSDCQNITISNTKPKHDFNTAKCTQAVVALATIFLGVGEVHKAILGGPKVGVEG